MSADRGAASFGSRLRGARERRGVSLRQIANATKISIAALEALERDDISRLPGGIFSRAFVRAYAVEVGLDPEETIHQFIAQFPNDVAVTAGHPTSDRVEDREAIESDRQTAGTFLWLAVISVPIAAALLYFASRGAPHAPPAAALLPAPSATPSAPAGASTSASMPATESSDALTIELSVRRPCWVSVTIDGRKVIEQLLQPGDRQTIDVRGEMVLTAGDAGAVAMTVNGEEARPLGQPGEAVTARVNLANFRNYLHVR